MSDAEAARTKLNEFGAAADLISGTNTAYKALADLATSATAASSDAEADSNAILAIYDALEEDSGDARPDDFVDWVEWFTIPTDNGRCRIEGTVDKADKTHDFYIYYLVGDCGTNTRKDIIISKSARWVNNNAIVYSGPRTPRPSVLRNRKRTYGLKANTEKDVVAWAVKKKFSFKPTKPRTVPLDEIF